MAETLLMVFRSAGAFLGVETDRVLGVSPWQRARRLPRGAPWLEGLLEEEGELVPVLREEVLGSKSEEPEVLILVEEGGRRLAIPGRGPVLRVKDDTARAGAGGDGGGPSEENDGASEVRVLDLRLLYTTLGLLYNETGSNRGS